MKRLLQIDADLEVTHGPDVVAVSGEGDRLKIAFPGVGSAFRVFRHVGRQQLRTLARLADVVADRSHGGVLVTIGSRPVLTFGTASRRSLRRRLLGI